MKKRLKGLLALTLALCLVLGMTTGIASAAAVFEKGDDDVINAGDTVYSAESGGIDVIYKINRENKAKSFHADQWTSEKPGNKITISAWETLFDEETLLGYLKTSWNVSETYSVNDNGLSKDVVVLTLSPINYTIKYVPGEGATGTPNEVQFTVEDTDLPSVANPVVDLGFKKDGYVADSKWQLKDGSQVNVDVDISSIFNQLINNAVVDPTDPTQATITLTALWTDNSGSALPEAEPEEDDGDKKDKDNKDKPDGSPDTGDDSNMLPWVMLMMASMITAAGVTVTSYRRKA